VFGLILLAPILIQFGLSHLKTKKIGYMALRGIFNAVAMLTYFLALGLLPLSEISALTFTVPLFVAVLAVMFLGERLGPRRISSLVIGFSGALIILRPGIEIIGLGAVYALFSAATWAVAVIIIKFLSRTESSVTITIYGLFFLAIFTMPPALFVWEWPTGKQYIWLVTLALAGTIGQLLFAQSMKEADATLVMPFDFTKLIWASLFGFFIFSEMPAIWTIAGGFIIFASASYLTYREGRGPKPLDAA
jgi:drug/metabolite transporter (DMT)-like permease